MTPTDLCNLSGKPGDSGLSAGPMENVAIDISVRAAAWNGVDNLNELTRAAIFQTLRVVPVKIPAHPVEISVVFAGAAFVARLNQDYRGKAGATNVLSFPAAGEGDFGATLLGDVVLAFEVVAREARAGRMSVGHHTSHLLVHGTLHLLGYDHILDKDAQIMEALEVDILRRLDIANPYLVDTNELEQ